MIGRKNEKESTAMWRMPYTILRNLFRLPKILETLHRMTDQPETYSQQEVYDYVRYIVGLMERTGHVKTNTFGQENLPKEGGYVLFPNHQGQYDAYSLVAAHEGALSLVMDRGRSYFVFVSEIVDALGGKRMDLHNSRQSLTIINQVAQEVAQGRRYILFPEGGYDQDKKNSLWEFKPGSFKAAVKAKAPIVPVVLVDSYQVYNSRKLTPVTTQVHYLPPLYYDDYHGMTTPQIAETVQARIGEKLAQLGYG